MPHHKHPGRNWDPQGLSERLRNCGLHCRIEGNTVRIAATVTDAMMWNAPDLDDPDRLDRIEWQRRIREIPNERPGTYEIIIRYLPGKCIRNVQLDRDQKMPLKPWGEYAKRIHRALSEHGYVEITPEMERDIVRRYCSNLNVVEELEEQIEHHKRPKETFVNNQDFKSAAHAREKEFCARQLGFHRHEGRQEHRVAYLTVPTNKWMNASRACKAGLLRSVEFTPERVILDRESFHEQDFRLAERVGHNASGTHLHLL